MDPWNEEEWVKGFVRHMAEQALAYLDNKPIELDAKPEIRVEARPEEQFVSDLKAAEDEAEASKKVSEADSDNPADLSDDDLMKWPLATLRDIAFDAGVPRDYLIGLDIPEVIKAYRKKLAKPEPVEEEGYTKEELQAMGRNDLTELAKDAGLDFDEDDTKKEILAKLFAYMEED